MTPAPRDTIPCPQPDEDSDDFLLTELFRQRRDPEILRAIAETDARTPPSGVLSHERSGDGNADERIYFGCFCSLVEFDNTDDTYLKWYLRIRDANDDEEILAEQHRGLLSLKAYGEPSRFHRAALSFVREEPECEDREP